MIWIGIYTLLDATPPRISSILHYKIRLIIYYRV